ncbi:uncharacterized protein LOC141680061 [Apium graveolens]|uniref:uncharacterized protein LOC141680061 n=1 Tax=Apium graveolens TaxID=4045 RepID=UPI003D7ACE24
MEWVQLKLGYQGMFVVDSVGRSGGLAMLWQEKDQVELMGFSQSHIDVRVNMEHGTPWRLTGLYGEPNRALRRRTWDLLRNLSRDSNLPWCVIGDVNNVVDVCDKLGGSQYPSWLIEGFNDALQDAGLTDMDIVGHQFTWERGRDTNEWMEVRLDRALVNLEWMNLFPMAKLYNLEAQFRFKFENAWMMEPMCEILVQDGWYSDSGESIFQKLKCCSKKLAIWGQEVTGNFSGRIKSCKVAMQQYRGGRDVDLKEKYREARNELTKILSQREVFWRQRSKQLWLQAGD